MTGNLAEDLKRIYQQQLLQAARQRMVFGQFGALYTIPGFTPREYTEEDKQRWYRARVARLRYNVTRNHRKPSKGKPLRLIPEREEY